MYDIIIIGAGPAGISAAIYGKSRGKNVLVLEKKQVGGLIGTVSTVTHYTAIVQGESGSTFAERMKEQLRQDLQGRSRKWPQIKEAMNLKL